MSCIYNIYINEVNKIKNSKKTDCIFLVGSSKGINLKEIDIKINDIDIFVISNQIENQIREIKEIDGIEFDINYFSNEYSYELINSKEYFFIKELKDAVVLYDKKGISDDLVNMSYKKYNEGPYKLTYDEKEDLKEELKIKISELKDIDKYSKLEYEFLTNIYLRDIIVAYFKLNNKWVPKDKKLIKEIKIEDKNMYDLILKVNENYDYIYLLELYRYIFR